MAEPLEAIGPDFVGRAKELGAIGAFLDRAAAGAAGALVVYGDAGVGKTALVQRACNSGGSEAWIFAGACLPLASMTVPFLALRSAFRGAPRIDGVAHPSLRTSGGAPHDVPVMIDRWLEELCLIRPVVLVIDDLQWADQSTLDVLMYLIAGPADRRLAVVATMRRGEVGEGHPLQRWLADIRRLPRILWIMLGPLDRLDTESQLTNLLGTPPHRSLVHEIFTHTAGNAYLNDLLVAGLQPDTRHLPAQLPSDLKAAILRSWRGLTPATRELTQIMAVGGRPIRAQDLAAVAPDAAMPGGVLAMLREAADTGTVDVSPAGTYWFHHPLIAEALEQGLSTDERQRWHAAFAAHYEHQLAGELTPDFESMVAVADHHHHAGHTDDAYRWALRAAASAGAVGGVTEMLRLLRRAVELRGSLPAADENRQDLWSRLRIAAEKTGSHEEELEAVEALLAGIDVATGPLDASELLVRRTHLLFSTGRAFMATKDMREAVRLAATEPTSWQYALALAELAHAGLWHKDPDAQSHADHALAVARAAGNPRALSYALSANAMAAVFAGRTGEALDFATEALAAAVQARDYWAFVHAALWQGNAQETWTSELYANLLRAGRQKLAELGAPHGYIAKLAADEAGSYLAIGRWRECQQALRIALGSDPGTMGDVGARLTAARLASWQGRHPEAQAHLARAEELYAQKSEFLNLDFDAIRAEVYVAAGNPEVAYDAAMTGATSAGTPPTMCEWLVPLAARALADRIQLARDAGKPTAVLMALVDRLVQRFPAAIPDFSGRTEVYERQITAFNLLYAAEVGRARLSAGNGLEWGRAADACQTASLLWEAAYACWRAAESLLLRGHTQRGPAAAYLRLGVALAGDLQAGPIQALLIELAGRARIPITEPVGGTPQAARQELPGLTTREREILAYVIAGRTYGEIARGLVISEKTVSSHISNLLRKTGAANRLDLSRLATRRPADS
ncbi:AAA family ATPase [Paeniglutamicibacter antarcticus]|uniref:AAA family ATPase n=1 Tax=Arthrobacter terrae TaxID=2935737 RepID=A0A931CLA5_9MICC|nr:AAA family ATPase [Arthrobacter terrae]MBG0737946.1 AAA family ATPase [Arthrobacter terrae]